MHARSVSSIAGRVAGRRIANVIATRVAQRVAAVAVASDSTHSHTASPVFVSRLHTASVRHQAIQASGHPKFVNPYAGTAPLTAEEIAVIKQTVPVLAEHGLTLTTMFYKKMLARNPALKNIFNEAHQATGMQPAALASAVYAYAANIDNLGALGPAVALMAHKHCSLSVLPPMYEIVGSNLLETLRELLTSAKFPQPTIEAVIKAWARAYAQLASILIEEEERLYTEMAARPGGWRGWRKFVVEKIEKETESGITSFYMKPKDGGPLPAYLPGQFTTINHPVTNEAGETFTQPRQYSLSQPSSGKYFRITVKREDAPTQAAAQSPAAGQCPFHRPAGRVSNALHSSLKVGSEVDLAPPFGQFTLNDAKTPVVLLGAGVGITPLATMADAAREAGRSVCFLYACDTGRAHPLKSWLADKSAAKPSEFTAKVWYRCPEADRDQQGRDYDEVGMMDLTRVPAEQLLQPGADYYLCGPSAFMTAQLTQLRKLGVPAEKLHAEAFGTGDVALNTQ